MENESTLAEEILQGKFERLWKLSLSNKNKDIIKKDIAVSASKEQGSKLVVNAINKLNFNKVPYKLASIGMPIVDGGLIFLFVTNGDESIFLPIDIAMLLGLIGTTVVSIIKTLKISAYIEAGKEYLSENDPEALEEVLNYEKEISLKESIKRIPTNIKRIFKKRNS